MARPNHSASFRNSEGKTIVITPADMGVGDGTESEQIAARDRFKADLKSSKDGDELASKRITSAIDAAKARSENKKSAQKLENSVKNVIDIRDKLNKAAKDNGIKPISQGETDMFKKMLDRGDVEGAMNQTQMLANRMRKEVRELVASAGIEPMDELAAKRERASSPSLFQSKLDRGDILGAIDQSIMEAESAKAFAQNARKESEENYQRIHQMAQDALNKYTLL